MRRFARSSTSTIAPTGRPRWSRPVDAHRGAVAVHHLAHLGRPAGTDRGPPSSRHEEAVAVGMAFDAAGDERDALRDEQRAGAVLHHLARALERARAPASNALRARALDAQALARARRP